MGKEKVKTNNVPYSFSGSKENKININCEGSCFVDSYIKIKKEYKKPYTHYEFTPLDIEFLRTVSRDKNIIVFLDKYSTSARFVKASNIDNIIQEQKSNSYYMSVCLKDYTKSRIKVVNYIDKNGNKKSFEKNYYDIRKYNIQTINELCIDMDIHGSKDEEIDYYHEYNKEYFTQLKNSILFYADELDIIKPTSIVYTGRGLQLHFVLSEPMYINSSKMFGYINQVYRVLKKEYHKILDNIDTEAKIDDNVNAICQKLRLPGSIHFTVGNRAETIYLDSNCLLDDREFLSQYAISYDEYKEIKKEREREEKESIEKYGKKTKARKKKEYTDKQKRAARQNSVNLHKGRVSDIETAIQFQQKQLKTYTGYRNKAYYLLVSEFLKLGYSKKYMASKLKEIDNELRYSYFANDKQIDRFINSAISSIKEWQTIYLTNKAIVDYNPWIKECIEEGCKFKVFGKKIRKEIRWEKRQDRFNHRKNLILELMDISIEKLKYFVQYFMSEYNISRNTVYRYHKISQVMNSRGKSKLTKLLKALDIKKNDFFFKIKSLLKKEATENNISNNLNRSLKSNSESSINANDELSKNNIYTDNIVLKNKRIKS